MAPHTIIFVGPQGSGKGTQIALLSRVMRAREPERRVVDIQTGRRFRALAATREGFTEEKVFETLDTGRLQPLFLSVVLWGDAFHQHVDPECHLLLDGVPRTVHEAHVLESALQFYRREHITVVNLAADEDVVRARMEKRARPDDTPASIDSRLQWYREETMPVLEYYRTRPNTTVLDLDGTKSIEDVHQEVLQALAME